MPQEKQSYLGLVRPMCEKLAAQQGLELCDVALEKENTGRYLRIYLDKEGGLTLDDCAAYHEKIMPKVEMFDYDFLEVCSLGIDRPVKTQRDIEKSIGLQVEVRFYSPQDGAKAIQGILMDMTDDFVRIDTPLGEKEYPRKKVALVKLVPDLSALEDESLCPDLENPEA